MGVDDVGSFDSVDGGNIGTIEISEKFKETAKKAAAGAARTQRDEGKAKKYDFFLSAFLVEMILEKKYDEILEPAISLLRDGCPSNLVLSILSITYDPISIKIREYFGARMIHPFHLQKKDVPTEFSDFDVDEQIKLRINIWIEDIIDSISLDASFVVTTRLKTIIHLEERLNPFIAVSLVFFLEQLNYITTESKLLPFSHFILSEIEKVLAQIHIEEI